MKVIEKIKKYAIELILGLLSVLSLAYTFTMDKHEVCGNLVFVDTTTAMLLIMVFSLATTGLVMMKTMNISTQELIDSLESKLIAIEIWVEKMSRKMF